MREGLYRLGNSQCKGLVVGSKVRIFEEQRESQFCEMGVREVEGDVAGQVGRGWTGLPCSPDEEWCFFLRAPACQRQVFQQAEVGVVGVI